MRELLLICLLLGTSTVWADPIRLTVDLKDAPRHVYHVSESIEVAPGQLALRYPKWIPGEQRGKKVNVSYTVPINFVLQ